MLDVRDWLASIDLAQYADAFDANDIDARALPRITDQDLKEIGIASLGHRRVLLGAIEALAEPQTEGPVASREAERRQLTVMFCDLVGSTHLSEKLDPEDLRDVMRAYQKATGEAIARYEGHIAQTLGDGLMVYFGYPTAHEDDAQRAVAAGLDILAAIKEADSAVTMEVRVGIHTGIVVAGEVGEFDTRGSLAIVGDTPNLAARVEALAEPNSVVVSERTHRLIEPLFTFEALGEQTLRGVEAPMALYSATGSRTAESRFAVMHPAGLTPFVGREEEIGLLKGCWLRAQDGEGQVVLLCGEPGIGKSRISGTFRKLAAGDDHTRIQYQCSPFFTNSAFHPIIQQVEFAAGMVADDDADARLDKLEAALALSAEDIAQVAPLFAAMMSLPNDRYPPLTLSPQRQKDLTIELAVAQITRLASERPVLVLFEDAHWIDPTTLEALDHLVALVAAHPVFLIVTFRPEFESTWTGMSHVSLLTLTRLGRWECAEMIERVASGKPLPEALVNQIIDKTDGVPLFIEELTKAVVESDIVVDAGDHYALSGAVDAIAIPDTLHDSLMARLDKLIPVKEVAQIGSALGREFSHELMTALSPMSQPELDAALNKLIDSELVHRRGVPPNATYTFKHALVQDAAYDSLLKRDRQDLHKEIADVLTQNFPSILETEPELLAHHYSEAGLADEAAPYWLSAGRNAIARTALPEAIEHLKQGMAEIESIPPSDARDHLELETRSALGTAYVALRGWAIPELEATLAPAVPLASRQNNHDQRLQALWGLWLYYVCLNEFDLALESVEQMLEIETVSGRDDALVVGHSAGSATRNWMGEFEKAQKHCGEVVRLYDVERHGHIAQWANHDPKCFALAWSTHWYWMLGYPDQAAAMSDEQLKLSRRLKHPFNLGFALTTGTGAYLHRQEMDTARSRIAEAVKIANDQSIPILELFLANFFDSEALLRNGQPELALQKVRTGLETWHEANGWVASSRGFGITALALAELGRHQEAHSTIDSGLALSEKKREGWYQAENHRVKGMLFLKNPEPDEMAAEACIKQAIEIARQQNARSWELRAVTSLARLWRSQGKAHEARELIGPVYDWFTEGFETGDLRDARKLLDQLR